MKEEERERERERERGERERERERKRKRESLRSVRITRKRYTRTGYGIRSVNIFVDR